MELAEFREMRLEPLGEMGRRRRGDTEVIQAEGEGSTVREKHWARPPSKGGV